MKLLTTLLSATALTLIALSVSHADPSENGVLHGERNGWAKQEMYNVPDSGSTLALLGLGMTSVLLFWKFQAKKA